MTGLYLKIASYIAPALIVAIFFTVRLLKQKKAHREELSGYKKTVKSLRNQIVEIINSQQEVNKIEKQSKQTKKDIDTMSDDDLSINYANKLPNMPRKSRKP